MATHIYGAGLVAGSPPHASLPHAACCVATLTAQAAAVERPSFLTLDHAQHACLPAYWCACLCSFTLINTSPMVSKYAKAGTKYNTPEFLATSSPANLTEQLVFLEKHVRRCGTHACMHAILHMRYPRYSAPGAGTGAGPCMLRGSSVAKLLHPHSRKPVHDGS